jgi:hypothetical protein
MEHSMSLDQLTMPMTSVNDLSDSVAAGAGRRTENQPVISPKNSLDVPTIPPGNPAVSATTLQRAAKPATLPPSTSATDLKIGVNGSIQTGSSANGSSFQATKIGVNLTKPIDKNTAVSFGVSKELKTSISPTGKITRSDIYLAEGKLTFVQKNLPSNVKLSKTLTLGAEFTDIEGKSGKGPLGSDKAVFSAMGKVNVSLPITDKLSAFAFASAQLRYDTPATSPLSVRLEQGVGLDLAPSKKIKLGLNATLREVANANGFELNRINTAIEANWAPEKLAGLTFNVKGEYIHPFNGDPDSVQATVGVSIPLP